MSVYAQRVHNIRANYTNAQSLKKEIDSLTETLGKKNMDYTVMLEAQQLLGVVSDKNTNAVLDYITGIINKALREIFPYSERTISLEKTLYRGQHAHINVSLKAEDGRKRDIVLQSGTGLRQLISFLFIISLIEIHKGRRILIMDELLSGLHPSAKSIIMDIVQIFAEEGFQFVFVEYGVNNVGKIYMVENVNATATVTPLGADDTYNNEVFIFNRPPEEVDKKVFVNEEDVDE